MAKVIVAGAGQWGRNLVRTFHELGALAGVAEADPGIRSRLEEEYPGLALYKDYRDALDTDVPAIIVATPAATHAQIAREALMAGKDLFIEKPMTLSVSDAEELVLLAEARQRILMVGHLLLYQPAIQKIKELIEQGTIGELRGLHQERLKLGRVRSIENVLWSFGVHDLAVMLYLTGQFPINVHAAGHCILQPEIEDDVYVHLKFAGGVTAHLHTSWLWPNQRRCLHVIGSTGMLTYDENEQTVILHRKTVDRLLMNVDLGEEVVFHGEAKPLTMECMHFLDCIESRRVPLSDGQNGLDVIRILETVSSKLRAGVVG